MIIQLKNDTCGEIVTRNVILQVYKSKKIACNKLINDCSSLLKIKESLNEYNIKAEGYFVEDFLLFYSSKKKIKFVTNLKIDNKSHFVICKKISRNFIKILFPEYGYKIMKVSKFLKYFSSNILIIETSKKVKKRKLNLIPKKQIISLCLISSIEVISCLIFFILFNSEKFKLFSFLTVPFILIIILCHHSLIIKYSNYLNNVFLEPYLTKNPSNEALKEATIVKNLFITYYNSLICLLFLSLFIIIYFFLFSLDKMILYLICFISGIIIEISFNKILFQKEKKIEIKESELFKDDTFNIDLFKTINEYGTKYAYLYKIKQFLIVLINITFILFKMFIDNKVDVLNLVSECVFINLILFYLLNLVSKLTKKQDPYSHFILLNKNIYEIESLFI